MRFEFHRRPVRQRFRRSARGQASVEFAMVIVLLMITIVSMLELIMLMHTYNTVADAAKEGVRYAIVHGSGNSTPCVQGSTTDIDGPAAPPGTVPGYGSTYGVVKTYAQYSLHNMAGMTVTVNYPDYVSAAKPGNSPPSRVQVVVTYPFHPMFGLGWPTVTVNAAAEGRIMN
ncbi:MAG TPA: TadE/TadG family type IV pilus assembly protein [Candidatus Binatus sp.]|jgi:Flp pilus assembly protein TadG|nr:TadE/TadG family type IV pilus assembly protein [Candidatus Binatus sp.]HWY22012.1 TadE/TadG family type IV pilus assembly protein [Candidatus Acidoferrum sp.]